MNKNISKSYENQVEDRERNARRIRSELPFSVAKHRAIQMSVTRLFYSTSHKHLKSHLV